MTKKDGTEDISKELEAMDMGEDEDDYFEKVLKEEITLPTDDDEDDDDTGSDTSQKKVAEDVSKDEPSIEEQLKAANDKVAQLEKEAKGRLSDTVKSRQEKAAMKAELSELKDAVASLLAKRDGALEGDKEEEKDPLAETKKGVEFDEDDKAYVDLSGVQKKIEEETGKTRAELDELKAERQAEKDKKAAEESIRRVLSEDEDKFVPSYPILQEAFQDLNNAVIKLQTRLEIADNEDGTLEMDHSLELLDGSPELKEFSEKYPGIDPTKIARAFNTKLDFRNGLRDIANAKGFGLDKEVGEIDEKIKNAKHKPGSLAGTADQAGGTADLLSRLSDLPTEELMSMSDAEVAKIEAMLDREARGE